MDCFAQTVKEEGFRALFKVGTDLLGFVMYRIPVAALSIAAIALSYAHIPLWKPAIQIFLAMHLQGLWPNYVKVVPSIAIAFVTYEQVQLSEAWKLT